MCALCGANKESGVGREGGSRQNTRTVSLEDVELKGGEKAKMGCGGKKCVLVRYRRNPVMMEWESAGGKYTRCGVNFVV